MVLTDQGFATGADAVVAAKNEAMGDFVIYFNTTVNVGEPAVRGRDSTRRTRSPASPTSTRWRDLQAANFDAGDFIFA